MPSDSINAQQPGVIVSLESLDQSLSVANQVTLVVPTDQTAFISVPSIVPWVSITPVAQDPDLTLPRAPGAGRGRILRIARDFDAPLEW